MGTPHVPQRRCIACGSHAPKSELARFVAALQGDERRLVRDDGGRVAGRGLYVCPSRACFAAAITRRAFARAARCRGERIVIDESLADAFE